MEKEGKTTPKDVAQNIFTILNFEDTQSILSLVIKEVILEASVNLSFGNLYSLRRLGIDKTNSWCSFYSKASEKSVCSQYYTSVLDWYSKKKVETLRKKLRKIKKKLSFFVPVDFDVYQKSGSDLLFTRKFNLNNWTYIRKVFWDCWVQWRQRSRAKKRFCGSNW